MTEVEAMLAMLRSRKLTSDEWTELNLAMLAEWRRLFEGTEQFPVRL